MYVPTNTEGLNRKPCDVVLRLQEEFFIEPEDFSEKRYMGKI
jgi:hypothetical protein